MYHVYIYVPESHIDEVKTTMFAIGLGKIGSYSHCCWQTKGQGQFLPNESSNPFIGEVSSISYVDEYKLEFICENESSLKELKKALKVSHPYEVPAYGVIKLENY
ncbi:NGG1p interacting factor NIF3 [Thiotrichales bacterium 19S11-10]|nr:NGG1p interacting factor NIF3 [Thiotrichales bacterium 19S11-10]MCF6807584.1 NGG1p interacting factor NIF3 [Thiotrichales bacterium 19S9-11]MCF6811553.1 NGG1p interacting factor NIF3 [Thiotrichales bacterium 19S9-12]